ncbi:MAG: secretin N-terminal domain-containing protein [Candidatus Omnitrophota bacterium]
MKIKIFLNLFVIVFILSSVSFAQEETISLDIKGMDIVDVLKTLAMRSGLNIVVGKNVVGKVTIFIKDVRPRQALDIILLANDLAYEERDGIINVMTSRDYEGIFGEKFLDKKEAFVKKLQYAKATNLVAALNQMKSSIGRIVADEASNIVVLMDTPDKLNQMKQMLLEIDRPTQSRIFDLNYSNSEKLKTKIEGMLTKNIGSITIDERTNKMVVVDYPEKLEEISKMVGAFDSRTRQVLIDSKIIEITLSDKYQLGIDWEYWIKKNIKLGNAFPLSLTSGGTITVGTTTTLDETGEYKSILQMLDTIGDTRVLSSPRVTALNNEEAKILVGTKDAYITQTTSQSGTGATITAESVNFVDVGIQLYVTPIINQEGFVTMKIKPVVSSATRTNITSGGTVSQIPIVSTSEAATSVMVRDGSTIIIAGLIKDENIRTVNKIPILGDIPLLGNVFKNTSDEVKKKELVIFLTPHILSTALSEAGYKDNTTEFKESLEYLEEHNRPAADKIRSIAPDTNKGAKKVREGIGQLTYPDYLASLRQAIARQSSKLLPEDFTDGEVEISFIIDARGQLKSEPEIISATNDSLKDFALKAVKASSPFAPFPKEIEKEQERFDIVISYVKE